MIGIGTYLNFYFQNKNDIKISNNYLSRKNQKKENFIKEKNELLTRFYK